MGTAYIQTTITAKEGVVVLFETECVAEIEYEIDGNDLCDWSIRDFRFDETEGRWNKIKGVYEYRKVGEAWCPDDLRAALTRYANRTKIEQRLIDHLTEAGELTLPGNSLRADYHASVL